MSTRLFQFSGERLGAIEWCEPRIGETLVADSWRVEDGEAVGCQRHLERFRESAVNECGFEATLIEKFHTAVLEAIPKTGSWFPRIEAVSTPGGATLRYRQRIAPDMLETVSLAVGLGDPRTHPTRKGPDLNVLMALRKSVSASGASEALIVSPTGVLIEGAYSTLVFWKKNSRHLSVVPREFARIRSVTESIITDIATAREIPVREEALHVGDLEGSEVWVLSALHGIRLATHIVGGPTLAHNPSRRNEWQQAWWASRSVL
jgi:branched-subunit amino acid aminotransferase/4-amino-4-deoxychorismate lyase